jgi:hypothetical protein
MHKRELKIRAKLRVLAAVVFSSFQFRGSLDGCVKRVFIAVDSGGCQFVGGLDCCVRRFLFF